MLGWVRKYWLLGVGEEVGVKGEERRIWMNDLDEFGEGGGMGSGGVMWRVGWIREKGKKEVLYLEREVGGWREKLYEGVRGIEYGDEKGGEGWGVDVGVD